jgi:putative restriction endonuclease
MSVAWDTFGQRNGYPSLSHLHGAIQGYRNDEEIPNPTIGCVVLTNPVFFRQEDWIPLGDIWENAIVQGKSFDTEEPTSRDLWLRVETLLLQYLPARSTQETPAEWIDTETEPLYREVLSKVRMGQGAFRVLVTDGYRRRCAITGERTLPVLEAAHIKPYAEAGPHFLSNGILLRSDMHKLFDAGYLTVTRDLKVEVSKRIKEEFENGKEYNQFNGRPLEHLPDLAGSRPDPSFIDWHNTEVFKA